MCTCVRVQCTQLSKSRKGIFKFASAYSEDTDFPGAERILCWKVLSEASLEKRCFCSHIQIILISTFKNFHSQFFWKFPFPTLPRQFCKSCTKKKPGVFIAMWLRPSQPYTQIPVLPHVGPMTLSKLLNLSDPQFLLFLKRENHDTLFLSGEN